MMFLIRKKGEIGIVLIHNHKLFLGLIVKYRGNSMTFSEVSQVPIRVLSSKSRFHIDISPVYSYHGFDSKMGKTHIH